MAGGFILRHFHRRLQQPRAPDWSLPLGQGRRRGQAMSVRTKNTSSEWWKSANRKPSDSQIPTAPAAATFLRPEKTNPSESVTYLPGLLCYLCPSPLTSFQKLSLKY